MPELFSEIEFTDDDDNVFILNNFAFIETTDKDIITMVSYSNNETIRTKIKCSEDRQDDFFYWWNKVCFFRDDAKQDFPKRMLDNGTLAPNILAP